MAGESRIRQIYEARLIDGVNANPGSSQDGKFWRFDSATETFKYVCVGDGGDTDINTTYFTNFVTNIFDGLTTDDYLNSITRIDDTARFTLKSGTNKDLELGSLAWLDTVEADITLPGDTKVLYDNNDSIGGSDNFIYDYTLDRLKLKATINFDTSEGTYKEGIRYAGNYSWSLGNGANGTNSGSYNITSGYKAGASLGSTSLRNTIYGAYAGELMGSALEGSVFIGPYTGRRESSSNKFFLDNTDYGTESTAQNSSFMYADLGVERRLYIRDRLSVEKEGKFGYSELADTAGEYGMYQMSAATGGEPQWHDGSVWQTFANSTNTYLASTSFDGTNITFTLSDSTVLLPVLDISSINTTVFATSPSSPSTGQTTGSDYGYLQISNNSFDNNEGFTYVADLLWNNTSSTLQLPGNLQLTCGEGTYLSDNTFWTDGEHAYIKLEGTDIRIDNEEFPTDSIVGENVGGASYEVYKTKDEDNLQFRTFQNISLGDNNPYDRIKFEYSTDTDAILIGTTAERNRLDSEVDSLYNDAAIDRDNSGETLLVKALRPGSGVTFTDTEKYIQIDAVTTGGGGEVNTASNVGSGLEFFSDKNGVDLRFFTLSSGDSRINFNQATDPSTDPENTISLDLTITGDTETIVTSTTYSDTVYSRTHEASADDPTIYFKPLISDSVVFTTTANDELRMEVSASAVTGTNNGSGIEVFDSTSVMPNFEFNTIKAAPNHLTVTNNGGLLEFNVDGLTTNCISTVGGEQLFIIDTDNWNIVQKGITVDTTTGLSITSDITDIIISQDTEIPLFTTLGTPGTDSYLYTSTTNSTTSKIVNNFTYSEDVRNDSTVYETKFFELNIGTGLEYDPTTNTLSSLFASDYALRQLELVSDNDTEKTYRFHVKDALGTTTEATYDLVIPKTTSAANLPIADYTDVIGTTGNLGAIKVLEKDVVWTDSTQRHLTLDELTGKVSIKQELVTYDAQNPLLDGTQSTEIIGKRDTARANVGAAYAEGSSEIDFNTKDVTVSGQINATEDVSTTTHLIGGLEITDQLIEGNNTRATIVIRSTEDGGYGEGAKITLSPNHLDLQMGDDQNLGNVRIKNASGTTVAKITQDGNLIVAGNIYAKGNIEGFDTTTTL